MDAAGPKRDNTTPSCAVCQRRKVKCNRTYPCAPCQKTGLECTFKPPETRHRQKRVKRNSETEEAQRGEGAGPGTAIAGQSTPLRPREPSQLSPSSMPNTARMIPDGGGYRYVDNHLWNAIATQPGDTATPSATAPDGSTPGTLNAANLRSPEGRSGDSIYESAVQLGSEMVGGHSNGHYIATPSQAPASRSFIFKQPQGFQSGGAVGAATQPPPGHVIYLWQAYLANVDPMMKVFHAPTVQPTVLGQIGKAYLAVNEQALTSAIYLISTVSLTEEECHASLQQSRTELVRRFRFATEEALSAANFVISTDIVVLQAFVLYLAALRSLSETPLVWSMTGLAIRVAGSIGLARDGSLLGLPPFECEMRRRLWWAIVYLDARTAELMGQDGDLLVQNYDVQTPSAINDSELFPNMQHLPEGRQAATDVIYVQLRAILAMHFRGLPGDSSRAGTWQRMRSMSVSVSEKLDIVESLEQKLNDEYLRYCDATVPLQLLTLNSAQTMANKLRLVGNVPLSRDSAVTQPDEGASENMFQMSMRIVQLQLDLWTTPSLQRWRWHWQGQFQWYALAELIRQTRMRQPGPTTLKAWAVIRNVFDIVIPTLEIAKKKSPLLEAIRALLSSATGQDQSSKAVGPSAATNGEPSPPDNPAIPVARMTTSDNTGAAGSGPHNALLPGMLSSSTTDPALTGQSEVDVASTSLDDATFGLDFDAIDWDEFDRLTSELVGQ